MAALISESLYVQSVVIRRVLEDVLISVLISVLMGVLIGVLTATDRDRD